jgi:2-phospho-L-lactate guanylyltransferase
VTCWAVIPIKASAESKTRLAGVLAPDERQALVGVMLGRVVEAAQDARSIARVCLVGPSRMGLPDAIRLLNDPGRGLNPAVQSALAEIADEDIDRIVIIAADLPQVTAQELDLLAAAPADTIAIAPDRHETGTNALSLPLPAARDFRFAYGTDSFSRHKAEAERLGLGLEIVLSRGLEYDIDEPEDLAHVQDTSGHV